MPDEDIAALQRAAEDTADEERRAVQRGADWLASLPMAARLDTMRVALDAYSEVYEDSRHQQRDHEHALRTALADAAGVLARAVLALVEASEGKTAGCIRCGCVVGHGGRGCGGQCGGAAQLAATKAPQAAAAPSVPVLNVSPTIETYHYQALPTDWQKTEDALRGQWDIITAPSAAQGGEPRAVERVEWNPRDDVWKAATVLERRNEGRELAMVIELDENGQVLIVDARHTRPLNAETTAPQGEARVWRGQRTDPPAPGPHEIGVQVRDRHGYVWVHERWTVTSGWWCSTTATKPEDGSLPPGMRFGGLVSNRGPLTEVVPETGGDAR